MKVTTFIMSMILTVVLLFVGLTVFMQSKNAAQKETILNYQRIDQLKKFQTLFEIMGQDLETVNLDYSFWDEFAQFMRRYNDVWASTYLVTSLDTFKFDLIWVFDKKFESYYHTEKSKVDFSVLQKIVLPKLLREKFAHQKFLHFFISYQGQPLEIRASTINFAQGEIRQRTSPIEGYWLTGRLLDASVLARLGKLSGLRVSLETPSVRHGSQPAEERKMDNLIRVYHPLRDINDKVIFQLQAEQLSELGRVMDDSNRHAIVQFVLFSCIILVMLIWMLQQRVLSPLRKIAQALQLKDLRLLEQMGQTKNEFGDISCAIQSYFQSEKENAAIRAQLFLSDKMASIGSLATGVAHEINNPLMIIGGHVEVLEDLMKMGEIQNKMAKESVAQINECYVRIATIVKSLRSYAHADSDKSECFSINELLKNTHALLSTLYKKENIHVLLDLRCQNSAVEGYKGKLQQVVMNLVTNARDALIEQGAANPEKVIWLSSSSSPGQVIIEVRDNGTGIAPEHQSRIFDPFFTTKKIGQGTGIGLSISYQIIREHGGVITVTSELGQGTSMAVTLNSAQSDQMAA